MYQSLIENAASAFAQLLRPGVLPSKKLKTKEALITETELRAAYHKAEAGDLKPDASFKRKHGILSKKGKAKAAKDRVDSDWGFPLPNKGEPDAVRYAHAVLSRAHQATKYDAADVKKQVAKANRIIYGTANPTQKQKNDHAKKSAKNKESAGRLREWFPTNPPGSWERISSAIQKAAQDSAEFGGPANDDPKLNSEDTVRSWDIYVYASFPAKSAVYIANSKTGKIWATRFACDDDENVTFTKVVPVEIALKVAESLRKRAKVVAKERAATVSGKLREYVPIASKGSWERNSALVAKAAQECTQFGGTSSCGSWQIGIYASYPDKSMVIVSNTDTGKLYAAKYEIDDDGIVTFPVVKSADLTISVQEALRSLTPARTRESAKTSDKSAESLSFTARMREAKITDGKGATATCVMLEEGPGNPVDGHYYTADCILDAAQSGIFEGKQNFADHPDEIQERTRPERSVRDLIGWWSDVHVENAGGKAQLIGTYNIETGNDFALNKMREAKRYQEKYPDDPEKQYVGFSIYAGGTSELREIDGKEYKAVLRITEAGSTDMVTRAGAKGRMVSLQEAMTLAKTAERGANQIGKKQLEEAASSLLAEFEKKVKTSALTESQIGDALGDGLKKIFAESKMEVDDKHIDGLKKGLAKHVSKALMGGKSADGEEDEESAKGNPEEEEDNESDDAMGEGVTGDDDIDSLLGNDEDPDDDGDNDEDPNEDDDNDADFLKKKKKEAAKLLAAKAREAAGGSQSVDESAKLKAQLAEAQSEIKKLKAREAVGVARSTAVGIIKEMKIPTKEAREYLLQEMLRTGGSEKKMREYATATYNALLKPIHGNAVNGVPAYVRESAPATTAMFNVTGIVRD